MKELIMNILDIEPMTKEEKKAIPLFLIVVGIIVLSAVLENL